MVKLDDFAGELAEINGFALQLHHAGLGLGDIHERVQHVEDSLGFLDTISEGLASSGGVRPRLQRLFGGGAQAGQRRAQVVGDIIQGLAHGAEQRLIFVEEPVEHADQFVEFIVGGAERDAGIELAGADNRARGRDDLAHGLRGAVREERPR